MQSKQPELYAAMLTTFPVAFVSLVLRLVARRVKKARLWYDDYMSIASFIVASSFVAETFWWIDLGLGLHLQDIPRSKEVVIYNSYRALWIADLVYATSLAFSKMSILLFYWRLFSNTSIRLPIRGLFACVVIWLTIRIILTVIQCIPPEAYWDKTIKNPVCPINPSKFFFGTVFVHILMDVVIIALPAWEVRKLHLPMMQKLGISAMFASGIFVCCASILQLIASFSYDPFSEDVEWNISPIVIWAHVEVHLSIMSTCLPILRPIYTALHRRRHPTSSTASPNGAFSSYKHSDRSPHKHFEWLSGFTQTGRVLESDSTHQLQLEHERHGDVEHGSDEYDERVGNQEGIALSSITSGIVVKKEVVQEVSAAH